LLSEISRAIFEAPMISPLSFLIGDTVREISMRRPSFVSRIVSVVIDAFALPDSTKDEGFFVLPIHRDKNGHRLSHRFFRSVAKEKLGAAVPARDDPVQVF
jgi:hypothetical protein